MTIKLEKSAVLSLASKVARAQETLATLRAVSLDPDASPETVAGWFKELDKRLSKVGKVTDEWSVLLGEWLE